MEPTCDPERTDALCFWNSALVNIPVRDTRWQRFRESIQQQRFHFKALQLVVTRYTCTQWRSSKMLKFDDSGVGDDNRDNGFSCRNCVNRHYRAGCMCPIHLYHILPMPTYRGNVEILEACLKEIGSTSALSTCNKKWLARIPQVQYRM